MESVDLAHMVCAHGRKLSELCPGCAAKQPAETFGKQFGPVQPEIESPFGFPVDYIRCEHSIPVGRPCVKCPNGAANHLIKWAKTDALVSIGGGPTRATILPTAAADRKKYPVATGLLDYFPDALAAVSNLSYVGNEQHNPGQPLHWARGKSTDEADTMMRHFLQRGTVDTDGIAHSVKMAWRALALLQKELESKEKK